MSQMSNPEKVQGIRIQKVIAKAGIASRRAAEELISAGKVKLNGLPATLGQRMKVDNDRLTVGGKPVRWLNRERVVYAIYKPRNCVTTLNDPEGRSTVKEYFPQSGHALFPVGRLDYDAEGLLLITNDGDFAEQAIHPKYKLWKTYFVKLKGKIADSELTGLRKGPHLQGRQHLPIRVKVIHWVNDKSWLEVSLQEGKNRQIKKMFQSVGYRVLRIKRYSIGSITLEGLQPGMSRLLTSREITRLLEGS